jgi:hypothetical protein
VFGMGMALKQEAKVPMDRKEIGFPASEEQGLRPMLGRQFEET